MVLFSLVSKQAMANIIPALHLQPKHIILFSTNEEVQTAEAVSKLLRKRGFSVAAAETRVSAYNGREVYTAVQQELQKLPNAETAVLNATGGTKIMAFSAYQLFLEKHLRIVYCNTADHQLMTLFPNQEQQPFRIVLSAEEYLQAHGYTITNVPTSTFPPETEEFYRRAVIPRLQDFIKFFEIVRRRDLNQRLTAQAEKFKFEYRRKEQAVTLLDKQTNLKAHFNGYNYGQWLEDLAFLRINDLSPDDLLSGVKIQSLHGAKNELDVVATLNGQIAFISCKTGSIDNLDVHQLLSMKNLAGGTFGKGILVLPDRSAKNFIPLAQDFGFTIYTPEELMSGAIF